MIDEHYAAQIAALDGKDPALKAAVEDFRADEAGEAAVRTCPDGLDRRRAALTRCLLEGGAAHGDHLLAVRRLDGGDGVARIDRPRERIRALHRKDIRYLHHIEQGRDARRDVLAGGGGGHDERVMAAHQLDDERRDILGQRMIEGGIVGDQHLGDARDLAGGFRDAAYARAGDQRMDFAELARGGDGGERRVLDRAALMFDPNQNAHATTPRFLSLPTSSSTSATLMPATRFGGSATLSVLSRAVVSTP